MYRGDSSKKTYLYSICIACITLGFIAYHAIFFSPGFLEYYSSYCIYPLLKLNQTLYKWVQPSFENRRDKQIEKLTQERLSLISENTRLQTELKWLKDTHDLRLFHHRYNTQERLITQILTTTLSESEQTLLIDQGSVNGVQIGMVAVYKNILVGKVTYVWAQYSRVTLITDKQCKIAAYCAHTGTKGVWHGTNNNLQATLEHVCHLATLKKDDSVLSSGKGHIFPAGFVLGTITSYYHDGLLYHIQVSPTIDFTTLEYCYLITI